MRAGIRLVSGGTDNHLILVDCNSVGISGLKAQNALQGAGIITNRNTIPYDQRAQAGAPPLNIAELEQKSREELIAIAQEMGLEDVYALRKSDLIFRLLQAQAEARGNVFSGGFLEVSDDGNYGFLRGASMLPGPNDIYVSQSQLRRPVGSIRRRLSGNRHGIGAVACVGGREQGHSGSPLLLVRRSPGPAWPQSVTASEGSRGEQELGMPGDSRDGRWQRWEMGWQKLGRRSIPSLAIAPASDIRCAGNHAPLLSPGGTAGDGSESRIIRVMKRCTGVVMSPCLSPCGGGGERLVRVADVRAG